MAELEPWAVEPRDGRYVVKLIGDLDLSNVDQLRKTLESAPASTAHLLIDAGELSFMDSSGIAVLLESVNRGVTVTLRNPSAMIRRLIDITGVAEVLRIEP
jgi:anti-anti-sigma factor